MSLAKNIREQLLKSFRAELAEHIQSMTDGLLAIERSETQGQPLENGVLDTTFRAAHSLKGAARAMGVTAIEQIAHELESILDGFRKGTLPRSADIFTPCYQALDTIQLVQNSYEAGETTPPIQALLILTELNKIRTQIGAAKAAPSAAQAEAPAAEVAPNMAAPDLAAPIQTAPDSTPPAQPAGESAAPKAATWGAAGEETLPAAPLEPSGAPAKSAPVQNIPPGEAAQYPSPASSPNSLNDETIRVDVQKLDAIMAGLSELLVARIRLEQRHSQLHKLQRQLYTLQRAWSPVRSAYNRLTRQQESGLLSLHRPRSVDVFPNHSEGSVNLNHVLNNRSTANIMAASGSVVEIKGLIGLSKDSFTLMRYVHASLEQLHQINETVNELSNQYAADMSHFSLVVDEMESEIKRLRLLPFGTITTTFARVVRDLAQKSGKEAALTLSGSETQIDKRILEGIKDPLMHLLRNAVDHGIEKPGLRHARGKPRTGQIIVSAENAGKNVIIRVSDDGAGLDLEAIRQAAAHQSDLRRGDRSTQALSQAELIDTIFNLGITTSQIITDVSGRGVGLNVVRSNIEAMHGQINVETRPGEGTTFTLTLPIVMTGTRGLFLRVADQTFAIPIINVERMVSFTPAEIFSLEGQDTIQYADNPISLVSLKDVLAIPAPDEAALNGSKKLVAVVLTANDQQVGHHAALHATRRMAFIVDELIGEQEVVTKDLGKQLSKVNGIAGATVIGDGKAVFVLNAGELMALALQHGRRSILEAAQPQAHKGPAHADRCILVVDDSITTRTLEKNILEAAGYRVQIATDGYEALNIIRSTDCPDLVVTDIVMPRMDGFELTRQIKSDLQTAHLPVILVTSLDSLEDKEQGIEVQADAYIVKSSFDQDNLLDTINQLI